MARRRTSAPAPVPVRRRRDLPVEGQVLLLVTLGLTAFGQVMVYSASSPTGLTNAQYGHDSLYFVKHGVVFTVLGVLAMLAAMRVPPRWLRSGGPLFLAASLLLLTAVLVPGVGQRLNGAQRWIAVGPLTLQPSELAKLALLGTVAALLAGRRRPPQRLAEVARPIGLLTIVVCGLVLAEPDLGSALAIGLMVLAMLVVTGVPGGLLLRLGLLSAGAVGLAVASAPYRRARFLAFLHPWDHAHAADASFQVVQAMIGLGSGGVAGVGLGESVQKWSYLPEAHTDMIFAVIGEELGLVGTAIVVGGFAAFAWAGFTIALRARDPFGKLVAAGATALVAGQAAINLGAVTSILPLTGVPLPLISFGSSSKVVTLVMVGVVLAICRDAGVPVARAKPRPAIAEAEPERRTAAAR
jgi:cell division protein FtsW